MVGGQRAYSPAAFRMLFRTCPDCHAAMRLWRIEPKLMEKRVDTHFFECDRCGRATSEDIARTACDPARG
jgi:DNA-directed RNA polymerase subunit M/transcription elongation factor TFIIS